MDPKEVIDEAPKKLFINNHFVQAASGGTLQTLNPYTGEVLAEVSAAEAADVDAAVAAAREAFDQGPWPRMTGKERSKFLLRWADKLRADIEKLALLESLDNGKPLAIAQAVDLPVCIANLEYFAGWADGKICGKTVPLATPTAIGYTLHEPIGVCAGIIPWNFPLLMFIWKVAPALAVGNTVVIKPAETTPLSALMAADLAVTAGLPEGVLNVVPGLGDKAGAALAAHPGINHLAFTGSTKTGALVAALAARNVVPTTLELGGKAACIVDKSADLDEAVAETHSALFFNSGQVCTAGSRTFVHEDVYDEFVEKAAAMARKLKVGSPLEPDTQQGPLNNKLQLDKTLGFFESAKREGATLLTGGKRADLQPNGYSVEPTVFANVTDDMSIARDEIFGPVQSILKYKTLDEVIERANSTPYGLSAGIWAKDIDVVNTLTRSLKAGTVWVGMYNVVDAGMPFGGYKMSGYGREGGEYGLHEYYQVKAVFQNFKGPTPWR